MKISTGQGWPLFTLLSALLLSAVSAQKSKIPVLVNGMHSTKQLGRFPITKNDRVWNLAFSPDGEQLYSVADFVSRHQWRKPGHQHHLWVPRENESMSHAIFSPDSSMFARFENGKDVHIHRAKDGKLIRTLSREDSESRSLAGCWGTAGKRFVAGGQAEIILWDVETGKVLQRIPQGVSSIVTVGISPDGKKIVAGNRDSKGTEGLLYLHTIDGSDKPLQLEEGSCWGSRTPMSFSPDGRTVAGPAELNGRSLFCIWDAKTGKVIHRIRDGGYNFGVYSPDGKWVAACGLNNLQVWDAKTGKEIFRHQGESINQHVWSLAFSSKGDVLAAGIEKSIRFFDTRTWKVIKPSDTHHTPVLSVRFSDDGKYLVSGDKEGRLVLWDWEEKSKLWVNTELAHRSFNKIAGREKPIQVRAWGIQAMSMSHDNSLIAVCANAGRYENRRVFDSKAFSIIETESGQVLRSFGTGGGGRRGIIISRDNKTAYAGSYTGSIDSWNIADGHLIRKIGTSGKEANEPSRDQYLGSLKFAADSDDYIWWTEEHHKLGKRRLSDGKDVVTLSGGSGTNRGEIHLSPHGDWIASGKTLWHLPSEELIDPFHSNESFSSSRLPHPSGLISVATIGRKAILLDMLTRKPMMTIDFGPGEILSITFSPNGESLVAAGEFGIKYLDYSTFAQFWNAEKLTKQQLWELMGGEHAWNAYQATWAMGKKPNWLEFIREQIQPAPEPTPAELSRLRVAMKDSDGQVAATAARLLLDIGFSLSKEEKESLRRPDERFHSSISFRGELGFPDSQPHLGAVPELLPLSHRSQGSRAIMLLQSDGSKAAIDILTNLTKGYSESPITKQAQWAIKCLSKGPDKR